MDEVAGLDLLARAGEEQAAAERALRDQHAPDVGRLTSEVSWLTAEVARQQREYSDSARELSAACHDVEAKFRGVEEE